MSKRRVRSFPPTMQHCKETHKSTSETASRHPHPSSELDLYLIPIDSDSSLDVPWNAPQNSAPSPSGWSSGNSLPFINLHRHNSHEQEAWTPLLVTGVPKIPDPSQGHSSQHIQRLCQRTDETPTIFLSPGCAKSSERDNRGSCSRYVDSGYGSKSSSSTYSIISSLCNVEPTSNPNVPSSHNWNQIDIGNSDDKRQPVYSTSSVQEVISTVGVHFQSQYIQNITCSYPNCPWTGKCPSDRRKHEARHRKQFKCDEPNCVRKDGFGTINDLERHKKCVHRKVPNRGPKKFYTCFGKDCPRSLKRWPRLDNFRQHLLRMHPEEDVEELLARSNERYQSYMSREEKADSLVDTSIMSPPRRSSPLLQKCDSHLDGSKAFHDIADGVIGPSQTVVNPEVDQGPSPGELILSPIKNISPLEMRTVNGYEEVNGASPASGAVASPDQGYVASPTIRWQMKLPRLKSLNLPQTPDQDASSSTATAPESDQHHIVSTLQSTASPGKSPDGAVNKVAMDVINALTRNLNKKRQVNVSEQENGQDCHGSKITAETASAPAGAITPDDSLNAHCDGLSDSQKKYLSTVFSAALEKLGRQVSNQTLSVIADESFTEQEGHWCDICHKRFRLNGELKKHKTRHEKPYGCTFGKCYKIFGSKADWKRHENSQHFHDQRWRCSLPREKDQGEECAKLYRQDNAFIDHLMKEHHLTRNDERAKNLLITNRIGRNRQSQYWCGFCREIIQLKRQGLEAWNERFDHIDRKHFKKGQRIGDWLPASGHLTKCILYETAKKKKQEKAEKKSTAARASPPGETTPTVNAVSDSESEVESLGNLSSSSSSCEDIDDGEDSPASDVNLVNRLQHRLTVDATINEPSIENTKSDVTMLPSIPPWPLNHRKRKFSTDRSLSGCQSGDEQSLVNEDVAEMQQQVQQLRNVIRRSEPSSLDEYHNDGEAALTDTRATPYVMDGQSQQRKQQEAAGKKPGGCQHVRYCCNCQQGPLNPYIMADCVVCSHKFCNNCDFVWT